MMDISLHYIEQGQGEPLILLIFAMLYFFWDLFAYIRKKYYLCSRKRF